MEGHVGIMDTPNSTTRRVAHPYAVLRPRAPPLEAAPRRKFINNKFAAKARRAVRLVVHEALVGDDASTPVKFHVTDDRKAVAQVSQLPIAHLPQAGAGPVQGAAQPGR